MRLAAPKRDVDEPPVRLRCGVVPQEAGRHHVGGKDRLVERIVDDERLRAGRPLGHGAKLGDLPHVLGPPGGREGEAEREHGFAVAGGGPGARDQQADDDDASDDLPDHPALFNGWR